MKIIDKLFGKLYKGEKSNKVYFDLINLFNSNFHFSGWSAKRAFEEAYRKNVWVYACVERRSRDLLLLPFTVKDKEGKTVANHDVVSLLRNPSEWIPDIHFWQRIYQHLDLSGNAFIQKVRINERVVSFVNIFPDRLVPKTDSLGILEGYQVVGSAGKLIPKEQIIHFKHVSPHDYYVGHSPIETLTTQVDTINEQDKFNFSNFKTGFTDNFVLKLKDNMTQEQAEVLHKRLSEKLSLTNHQGLRQFMIMNELDSVIKLSSVDNGTSAMLESRQEIKEEICAVFGIPLDLLGQTETSTYNNVASKQKDYWLSTILPLMRNICGTLTHSLQLDKHLKDGEYVWYDTLNVDALKPDQSQTTEIARMHFHIGVPFDVLNERFSLGYTEEQVQRTQEYNQMENENGTNIN